MYIQNYRPYRNASLNFATGDENITIILGENDAGKTSFINAFTWCLYGKEPFRDDGLEDRWNKSYVNEINVNENVEVKVEIIMDDNEGNEVHIIRSQSYTKKGHLSCSENGNSTLTIYQSDKNGENTKNPSPNKFIKNNLPESLQKYFIFTGERLTQFVNSGEGLVKEGVHTLYQLDLLFNVYKQAKNREKDYSKLYYEYNPKLAELKEKRSQLLDQKNIDENNYKTNEESILKLKVDIDTWKKEIETSGGDAGPIQTELSNLENQKIQKETQLDGVNVEYSQFLTKNISYILSYPLLKYLEKWRNFKEDKSEDMIRIDIGDLKQMLQSKECFCGNDLSIDENALNKLKNLLSLLEENDTFGKSIESYIDDLFKTSDGIFTRYPIDFNDKILDFNQKINRLETDIKSLEIDIEGLHIRLSRLNIDYINKLIQKIDDGENLLESLIGDNALIKENLQNFYPVAIKEIEEEIKEAEKKGIIQNEYGKKRDFCESVKIISKNLYDELVDEIHEELQDEVTHHFKSFHWKPDYKRVIIDKNFNVFIEKTGNDIISATDPSTGSRNVLAFAFMAALNSLSGFTLPQVIDTPIASLSGKLRKTVANSLPIYMEGKQVVLLVMDTEYVGSFKEDIQKYVGASYELQYIGGEGNGETIIREIDE